MDHTTHEQSNADRFFAAATPKSKIHPMPGVGDVNLIELSEGEVSEIRNRIESEKDLARRSKLFGMGLVVRTVHKDGKRVFSNADIVRFADAGNAAVEELVAAVLAINGYGAKQGDGKGN